MVFRILIIKHVQGMIVGLFWYHSTSDTHTVLLSCLGCNAQIYHRRDGITVVVITIYKNAEISHAIYHQIHSLTILLSFLRCVLIASYHRIDSSVVVLTFISFHNDIFHKNEKNPNSQSRTNYSTHSSSKLRCNDIYVNFEICPLPLPHITELTVASFFAQLLLKPTFSLDSRPYNAPVTSEICPLLPHITESTVSLFLSHAPTKRSTNKPKPIPLNAPDTKTS